MPTVAFHTLGCKVNQYETDALAGLFRGHGYQVVPFEEQADVYIINTCTVTNVGDRKSRQIIRRAAARPDATVVVTGCYAQTDPARIADIPGVSLVLGIQGRERIVDLVEAHRRGHRPQVLVGDVTARFEDIPVSEFGGRTRATLKIQEGCRQFCSYCKVPYARGPLRSMPGEQVIERIQALVGQGYMEIVLIGVHLGLYGSESGGGSQLVPLLERVLDVPGLVRLRLSSLEPMDIGEDFIRLFRKPSPLCPHLHLPLQSGCDETLQAMSRPYVAGGFLKIVESLRSVSPDIAISTDLIVGFPGETESHFEQSLRFCENVGFSRMHVFKYSPRTGTPAAALPGQIPESVKDERSRRIRQLASQMAFDFHRRFIGREVEVLAEECSGTLWSGLTPHYVRAEFESGAAVANRLYTVSIERGGVRGIWGSLREKVSCPEGNSGPDAE